MLAQISKYVYMAEDRTSFIFIRNSHRTEKVKVVRETNCQVFINGLKFNKKTGSEIGAASRFYTKQLVTREDYLLEMERKHNNRVKNIGYEIEKLDDAKHKLQCEIEMLELNYELDKANI